MNGAIFVTGHTEIEVFAGFAVEANLVVERFLAAVAVEFVVFGLLVEFVGEF